MLDETAAHILGGGIGGTVGAICTCPLELVKTRFQSSQGNAISGSCSSRPPFSSTVNLASSPVLIRSPQTVAIATHPSARIPTNRTPKSISFSLQFCRDFLLRSKIIHCMRDVCRTEGYRALFKGLVPTLVGVLPSRCIYFCAYHEGQKFFQQFFPEGHSAVFMLAAGCGSITASTVTNPIWYVKTRLQLDSRPKAPPITVWDIIKSTYREYGLRGFYRGISASYIGSLETALNFVVYEHVKGTLLFWGQKRNRQTEMVVAAEEGEGNWEECANVEGEDSGQHFRGSQGGSKLSANSDMIVCMGASALSKFVAITVSYPHEVVRTRMRERGNKYRTFVGTFMTVLREETWRGLYRGLGTHYVRQVPNSCIMIGTYEWVVYLLHSWNLVAARNE
nr:mitochondrial carrier protein [Hymenolepis microstoma]